MNAKKKMEKTVLDNNIGFLLYKAGLRMRLHLQHVFKKNGYSITIDHWSVIRVLYEKGGLSQIELANILEKNKANITRILDVMQKRGLIIRKVDPDDRRRHIVFLTDKATEMAKKLFPLVLSVKETSRRNLSAKEIEKLKETLNRIYYNITIT